MSESQLEERSRAMEQERKQRDGVQEIESGASLPAKSHPNHQASSESNDILSEKTPYASPPTSSSVVAASAGDDHSTTTNTTTNKEVSKKKKKNWWGFCLICMTENTLAHTLGL